MGAYFRQRLMEMGSPHVQTIRGKGLLIGIVLKPEAASARHFCAGLRAHGILAKDTHGTVIRLAPPLIITREQIDWAMERIEQVLD